MSLFRGRARRGASTEPLEVGLPQERRRGGLTRRWVLVALALAVVVGAIAGYVAYRT